MITTCLLLFLAIAIGPDDLRRHERILRAAIGKSGQTVQQAAMEAEIGHPQFIRQIQMLEGSHKRLVMQPREFWQWFAVEIAREFGLPAELETAARLRRASDLEMAS